MGGPAQLPWLALQERKVVPAGSGSFRVTSRAAIGPALERTTVKVSVPPTGAGFGAALLAAERTATDPPAVGVGVGVGVPVETAVPVGVAVGVAVGVPVETAVPVGVAVGVEVGVKEGVAVGVSVGVEVGVNVGVAVGV